MYLPVTFCDEKRDAWKEHHEASQPWMKMGIEIHARHKLNER